MLRSPRRRDVVLMATTPLLLATACISTPGLSGPVAPAGAGQVDTVAIATSEPCTLITTADLADLDFVSMGRRDAGGGLTTCWIDDAGNQHHEFGVLAFGPEGNDALFGFDPDRPDPETITIGRYPALHYTESGSEGCLIVIQAAATTQVVVAPSRSGIPCARTMSVSQVIEAKLP